MACVRRGLLSTETDNVMGSVTMSTVRRPIVQHSASDLDTIVTMEIVCKPAQYAEDTHYVMTNQI